jgi:dehydrogenase/reductase SDR family member 7B
MRFSGQLIWITGASSGIGESLASKFVSQGARVLISSNDIDELSRVEKDLSAFGEVISIPIDLKDHSSLTTIAEQVIHDYGPVDILINNGGISQRSFAVDTSIEIDKLIMDIDYFGHVMLTKSVLPSMIKRKKGHIVVTSSIMGRIGASRRSAYCAAKHALHGFYDSLRTEVWKDNILITIICPAGVQTNISANALTAEGRTYGKVDKIIKEGITADDCSRKIIIAIAEKKEELVIGKGKASYSVFFKRHMPGLFSYLIKRANHL